MRRLVLLAFLVPACDAGHLTISDDTGQDGRPDDTDVTGPETDAGSETDVIVDTDTHSAVDSGETDTPPPPGCGDGQLQAGRGEACDDGNVRSGDGCSSTCQVESCGDGITQRGLGEGCDDGNTTPGDGCTDCIVESCGDGAVQPALGELCDDGNHDDGDGCTAACLLERFKVVIVDATVEDERATGGHWDNLSAHPDPLAVGNVGQRTVITTRVEKEDTTPEWNQTFTITVLAGQTLTLTVKDDEEPFGPPETMCTLAAIPYADLIAWVDAGTQTLSALPTCTQLRLSVAHP